MTGNNPGAIEDFGKAVRFDPEDAPAYFNRGVAYYIIGGRLADAEADFKKASELNPKDPYVALWRDLAERRNNNVTGHLAEAAKEFDMTAWPAPIVRQFLGELSAERTVKMSRATIPGQSWGKPARPISTVENGRC